MASACSLVTELAGEHVVEARGDERIVGSRAEGRLHQAVLGRQLAAGGAQAGGAEQRRVLDALAAIASLELLERPRR
jgi:hypothetical protein